jgi:group I intron endonuclease
METQLKVGKSLIYSSILKNGLSKFLFGILEYCEPEKCLEREQYFLDLIKPEYNILKTAGSSLGRQHTEGTKAKIAAALKGKNAGEYHPMFGKARPGGAGKPHQKNLSFG